MADGLCCHLRLPLQAPLKHLMADWADPELALTLSPRHSAGMVPVSPRHSAGMVPVMVALTGLALLASPLQRPVASKSFAFWLWDHSELALTLLPRRSAGMVPVMVVPGCAELSQPLQRPAA